MMWTALQTDDLARLPKQMLNGVVSPVARADEQSPSDEAAGWKKCIDSLLEIRLLEDDWDGQGSPAPAPELVDSAIILAVLLRQKHVKPPCATVQSVTGTVLFDWQWPDHSLLEIDVIEPSLADVFLMVPDQKTQHWQLGESVAGLMHGGGS